MLRNFFKTAYRNILKYKSYSIINFIGLTCGIALTLLILVYVRSELSYDRFHEKADRLYRLRYSAPNGLELATSPPPIAPKLKDEFSEIEEVARVYIRNVSISLPNNQEAFEESTIAFADSAFTDMFSLEFIKGNPKNALHDKFTVLINEEMAEKYFGDQDPIGETLIFSGRQSFKVIGVVKDFPENSHLRFNMLVPYDDMFDLEDERTEAVLRNNLSRNFIISHSYTYILLRPGATPDNINAGMDAFIKKHAEPIFLVGQVFTLMPIVDIHLHSPLQAEPTATNTMTNIYIFIGVGILTLLIASINYINLSTAQSFTRMKEIGIRKIMGSMKYQLIVQFLAESFLFCLVSMMMAYLAFDAALPLLNQVTGKHLEFIQVVDGTLISLSFLLLVVISVLAGGYPAYFISSFESITALKGAGTTGDGNQFLRKILVVVQLSIACMLLSGSLLIVKQLNYLNSRPLGYQREHLINIPLYSQNLNGYFQQRDSTFQVRLQTFRDVVEGQTGIKKTSLSSGSPGTGSVFRGTVPEGFTREDNIFAANISVDYDFLKTYDIELIAGREFSMDYPSDAAEGFMVNETAVREFNWGTPEQALGKTIDREGKKGQVVGVVKDFNFTDLTVPISPLIMAVDRNQFNTLSVRFENANVESTITKLEQEWNKLFPEKAFEFTFLDEQLNQQYSNFQNFGTIIQVFTGIAILISCLGVYGLVLFTVQRKVKEIGVRKVLGANVSSILLLIYRDFAWLIVIGFILAVPVSYYMINQWFTNFIYHTNIDVGTYFISLALVFFVVSLTISYQAIRAAQGNPVNSLRSE
ncbi:MAG: ABC transporter permease [Cyclobacteriaceae bacterium]|nr:ABC transporter permease [Cyclobacteriaceae bacterium]